MKFGVIMADPNWEFKTYSAKGQKKSAQRHYACRDAGWIASLDVASIAADDCALFLWATWPTMPQWLDVIESWGFKYSGLAWEWIKKNPATGKYAFGTGYGTRKNLEPCLLARRGTPKLLSRSERDFIFSPKREHSRKPDDQYPIIERMYSGPYVELFGRPHNCRDGWVTLGNEVTGNDMALDLKLTAEKD